MTGAEICERYGIPLNVLEEYHKWGYCGAVKSIMEDWKYDDTDLERLSLIMVLHDIGFTSEEAEKYMRLTADETSTDSVRLKMLTEKRAKALDEIHFKEKQLEHIDYLRHEIRSKNN